MNSRDVSFLKECSYIYRPGRIDVAICKCNGSIRVGHVVDARLREYREFAREMTGIFGKFGHFSRGKSTLIQSGKRNLSIGMNSNGFYVFALLKIHAKEDRISRSKVLLLITKIKLFQGIINRNLLLLLKNGKILSLSFNAVDAWVLTATLRYVTFILRIMLAVWLFRLTLQLW